MDGEGTSPRYITAKITGSLNGDQRGSNFITASCRERARAITIPTFNAH